MSLISYIRNFRHRQHVRPWALAVPILVLLTALPLLRPLRAAHRLFDLPGSEISRLAAIQAWAQTNSQRIESTQFYYALLTRSQLDPNNVPYTVRANESVYSDRPPVMAFLLSGPYRLLAMMGISFQKNPMMALYILTLLGVTLPVVGAAGLIYRMGRLFELPRRWRTGLAAIVVFGSGLISYSVSMNSHAPAATLVLAACACLIHLTLSKSSAAWAWLMTCGLAAGFAAALDLGAVAFLAGFPLVILLFPGKWWHRILRVIMYAIGASPAIVLHALLTVPVTGDFLPGYLHANNNHAPLISGAAMDSPEDDSSTDTGIFYAAGDWATRILTAIAGSRGIFSHFPVLVMGLIGLILILRRHWPAPTKGMACVTLLAASAILLAHVILRADWTQAMFGPRWFIVFTPLLLFWSGAWLRRDHHASWWVVAAVLLFLSVLVSMIGVITPVVRPAPGQYTVSAAVRDIFVADPGLKEKGRR